MLCISLQRCAQHDRRQKCFNDSFSFQHERQIDPLAFRDVEATRRKKFPVLRHIREQRSGNRCRQNQEPRTGRAHELSGAASVQRREKTVYARTKIPD